MSTSSTKGETAESQPLDELAGEGFALKKILQEGIRLRFKSRNRELRLTQSTTAFSEEKKRIINQERLRLSHEAKKGTLMHLKTSNQPNPTPQRRRSSFGRQSTARSQAPNIKVEVPSSPSNDQKT